MEVCRIERQRVETHQIATEMLIYEILIRKWQIKLSILISLGPSPASQRMS